MSTLDYYAGLLEDRRRLVSFFDSIRATVKPGDRVVEVGAGLGTYAVAAKRAGAAEVVAIDMDPIAMALARELGVEREGVRLIESPVEHVELPERADVVIFEDFGGFGFTPHLARIFDRVQAKLAKPGARYVPSTVELHLAPADVDADHRLGEGGLPFPADGLEMFRKRVLNNPALKRVEMGRLLGPDVVAGRVRLAERIPRKGSYGGTAACARAGAVTGIVGWTVLEMPGGGGIDNRPEAKESSWMPVVFPFERPLPVASGERVEMSVEVTLAPGPRWLIWRWWARGAAGVREGCSVNAYPGDAELRRRGSPDYVPARSERLARAAAVLGALDGNRSVAGIARAAKGAFASEEEAMDEVFTLLERVGGLL